MLVSASLAMVGCASQMAWYNPSVRDVTQMQRDFAECKYDTTKYGYVPNQYFGVGDPVAAGITAGIEQAMRSNEVMRTCMASKGYTLQNIKEMQGKGAVYTRLN
jgi:hypothetical protein